MGRLVSGAGVTIFDSLDSTSMEAKRFLESGASAAIRERARWFVALTQTAGYGRRGRPWEQRTGDFAGTLLLKNEAPIEKLGQISFIAALALAAAFDEMVDAQSVSLKWPNDILLGGKKTAGILLESIGAHLAVGIGVNIANAPAGLPYPAARLADHMAQTPAPADLAARIDHHFWLFYNVWRAEGFGPIAKEWLARAAGLGGDITVRLPNETVTGVFDGLDQNGGLILRIGARKRTIAAGEVFFEPPQEEMQ